MTREEALTRLRLRSHQAFCEYVENGNQENEEAALDVLAYDMAIAALRGPQPDPDTGLVPCDFCTNTFERKPLLQENKYKPYTRMMSTISIEENNGKHHIEIDLWDGGNVYAAFGINYCPMCGRKLEVEG